MGGKMVVNPGLLNLICEGKSLDKEVLRAFQDRILVKNHSGSSFRETKRFF